MNPTATYTHLPNPNPRNDVYDYDPIPRGSYHSTQPNEPFALHQAHERYQTATNPTATYAQFPNLNSRTGAQRFNPDYQRDDYPSIPPAVVQTYPRASVATQTCPNEMNHTYERQNNVPATKSTMTTAATATTPTYTSEPGKKRSPLKLRDFAGIEPLPEFLHRFSVCAKHNEWSELEKANHLSCALVGEAAQVLWGHEAGPCDSADEIIERLNNRFGSSGQSALFQARLAARKQKRGEGLAELAQDIRTLMSKAFGGKSSPHSEAMGTKFYLDALYSKELALRVMEQEPKTLDDAIKVSLRLQAYRQATTESDEAYLRNAGRVK